MSVRQQVGRQRNRGSILGKDKTHLSSPKGQTGSGIYSACQQVPETLSLEIQWPGITHLHLVSRLRMDVAIPTFPYMLSSGTQSESYPLMCIMLRLVVCSTPYLNSGAFSYNEVFLVLKPALKSEMSLTSCRAETTSMLS
jgi:hypothetical protein